MNWQEIFVNLLPLFSELINSSLSIVAYFIGIGLTGVLLWGFTRISKSREVALNSNKWSNYILIVERFVKWQLIALHKSGKLLKTLDHVDNLKDDMFENVETLLNRKGLDTDLDIINGVIEETIENFLNEKYDMNIDLSD